VQIRRGPATVKGSLFCIIMPPVGIDREGAGVAMILSQETCLF